MGEDDRVRWHCRRGLLELDLVLSKFLNMRYATLSDAQKAVFMELLTYADNDLWDLLSGRSSTTDPAVQNLLELFE
jgi:antitoxin CptB